MEGAFSILVMLRGAAVRGWPWRADRRAPGGKGPGPPQARPRRRWRELSVPNVAGRVAFPPLQNPSATGRWRAAGSLDSHLGGARTLILPGRIGPATRESAWKKSASESSHDGPAFH